MSNILISTLHFYNNFGSVLQAYALKTVLEKLKNHVSIMPYKPDIPQYQYFQSEKLNLKYEEKVQKFDAFRKRYLGIEEASGTRVQDWQTYDAYVVGSDIVWGKEFSGLDPVYFLQFAPDESTKIAYAASTILLESGQTENDEVFSERLPFFDAIAVRETSSVEKIQSFVSNKVVDVLDPTLLLTKEDYVALEVETAEMYEKPYMLSYFLTHDPAVVDYTNMIAEKLGLRVIHYFADYPDRVFNSDAGCFAFAGPGEFLGYVKNAQFIFTNSFHGTCFSMIYRKPFRTYTANRAIISRVKDMVRKLDMGNQCFENFHNLSEVSLNIDYTQFEDRLKEQQVKSIGFLEGALKGKKNV